MCEGESAREKSDVNQISKYDWHETFYVCYARKSRQFHSS